MRLIFATHNHGKVAEMRKILAGLNLVILSADEAGVSESIVEDGLTFEENALIKARYISRKTKDWAFGDDSGVCIKALGCAPGVHSARWARKRGTGGAGARGEDIVSHTLEVMGHIPKGHRDAWFETACALVAPDGRHWIFNGKIEGVIAEEPKGIFNPRLPYDVIFIPKEHTHTFAEMTSDEKNSMSHRGAAFTELKKFLMKEFEE